MNQCIGLLTILAMSASSLANAADPPPVAKDCSKVDTYQEMVACYWELASEADAELERTYGNLMKKIPASAARDLLSTSQEAWLIYRTNFCSFVSSAVEGGSLQPTVRNMCRLKTTKARLGEIVHQLHCQEGDITCISWSARPQ